jgi:hypothetical protein
VDESKGNIADRLVHALREGGSSLADAHAKAATGLKTLTNKQVHAVFGSTLAELVARGHVRTEAAAQIASTMAQEMRMARLT